MGMFCMTSFVKKERIMKAYQLRDTKLVVDALSFVLSAHENYLDNESDSEEEEEKKEESLQDSEETLKKDNGQNTEEPGTNEASAREVNLEEIKEDVEFATYLKNQFKDYAECQIQLYVVFDGGHNDLNIKKKLNRGAKMTEEQMRTWAENPDIEFVYTPVVERDVLKDILKDMNIPYVTCCTEEADETMAALAKHFNCPIISNDSDFYLSAAPCIPFRSCIRDPGADFFRCEIFDRADFLQKFQLKEDVLPIILTVLQNDYFEPKFFDVFFRRCRINTHVYLRISGLLRWLTTQTYDTAAETVLNNIRYRERQNCAELLESSRRIVLGSQTETYAFKFLVDPPSVSVHINDPDWFNKGVASGRIDYSFIDLYIRKIYMCHPHDEFLPSLRILRYAFDLLTGFSGDWFLYVGVSVWRTVSTKYSVAPPIGYSYCVPFNSGWSSLPDYFGHFIRETLPGLPMAVLDDVPADCRLWLLTLVWWRIHSSKDASAETNALVLCRIRGAVRAGTERASRLGIGDMDRKRAVLAFRKLEHCQILDWVYRHRQSMVAGVDLEFSSRKRICWFVFMVKQINCLNQLCGSPYEPMRFPETYDSLFTRITFEAALVVKPDSFVVGRLLKLGKVWDLYNKLMNAFQVCMESVVAPQDLTE